MLMDSSSDPQCVLAVVISSCVCYACYWYVCINFLEIKIFRAVLAIGRFGIDRY